MRAIFHPQAWVSDNAIEVDPEGAIEWTVSDDYVVELAKAYNEPDQLFEASTYESDNLRSDPAAPEWIQSWHGPHWVEPIEDYDGEFNALLARIAQA